jgi:hypothetical protein
VPHSWWLQSYEYSKLNSSRSIGGSGYCTTIVKCAADVQTCNLSHCKCTTYEGVSKSFRTESVTKCTLTFGITDWEATQRVMVAKLTRLTHRIAIQLHLVAESCTICSSHSRWPVWKLLDTPPYSICCIRVSHLKPFWVLSKMNVQNCDPLVLISTVHLGMTIPLLWVPPLTWCRT